MAAALLAISGLRIWFGGILALDDVSFEVERGAIVGLIGPNGSGKTTLFNCVSRLYTPAAGNIRFEDRSVLAAAPHAIAALGIGRTFQNLALFQSMSVLENIKVGGHARTRSGFVSNALRLGRVQREEADLEQEALELVRFLELEAVAHTRVASLPFGTRKRVELARALASHPKLLLLDEPAGGLNHEEVAAIGRLIGAIRAQRGVTVLLVEHHMSLVMSVSEHVVVLDFGRKIAEGPPPAVRDDPAVVRAYLGTRR